MNADGILVRFGEIGIKSPPVRRAMLERLRRNLLAGMERSNVEGDVSSLGSRLWMVGPDVAGLAAVAGRTFGIVSFSASRRVTSDMASMERAACEEALAVPAWKSFAVRAHREGSHPYTSQEVAIRCGAAIQAAARGAKRPDKVDLGDPDLELSIDVRGAQAFVFTRSMEGPGGLPVGAQGAVVALLETPADSAAAWLMLRRGCTVHGVGAGAGRLPMWGLATARPGAWPEVLYEAGRLRAAAVVVGDGLTAPPREAGLPILRPLAGLDPAYAASVVARLEG